LKKLIKQVHGFGDIESLLFSDKHKNVYMALPSGMTPKGTDPNLLVTRMALDSNILPVPVVDVTVPDLGFYLDSLPSYGIVYATRNGRHVNYTIKDIRRDWSRLFVKNSLYMTFARTRYRTVRQALLEFHSSADRGNQLVEKLSFKLFSRPLTAYTQEVIARIFLGAAIVKKYSNFFKGLPKVPTPQGSL
jgi:hypothetical protein